jgi:thiol-disulfide isomerase/thioredoxin
MRKPLGTSLIFSTITLSAQQLPIFELVDMNGDTLRSESLEGKHVYINVRETTCQPCLAEIPILNHAVGKTEDIILHSVTADKRNKISRPLAKSPLNLREFLMRRSFAKRWVLKDTHHTTLLIRQETLKSLISHLGYYL